MVVVSDRDTIEQPPTEEVVGLPARARLIRLVIATAVLALTLSGTVFGDDYAFPFGPPRMYATRADPDTPVSSTRVVGLTESGAEVRLSGGEVGLRRAEFEGQVPRLVDDPELLGLLAESYLANNPAAPPLVAVAIVVRRYELRDGQSTGSYVDDVRVTYPLPGAAQAGA
ncbi:MAG: hypothetical protein H0U22_04060 [Geodermatophilaceae bacterium]|jgi:hypothetical protein|nr:hypothetical protein [Geodermatophilaceae bacterium]